MVVVGLPRGYIVAEILRVLHVLLFFETESYESIRMLQIVAKLPESRYLPVLGKPSVSNESHTALSGYDLEARASEELKG